MFGESTPIKIGNPADVEEDVAIEVTIDDLATEVVVEPEVVVQAEPEVVAKPEKADKAETNSRYQKRVKQLLSDTKEAQREAEDLRKSNAELLNRLQEGNKSSKTTLKASLEANITALNQQMKQAMQNGDTDAGIEFQDQLMDAKIELRELSRDLKHAEAEPVREYAPKESAIPDAAVEWIAEYPQFNKEPYFRNSVIVENNQMIAEGYDPKSNDFYEELNARLAPRFPKVFGVGETNSVSLNQKADSSTADNDTPDVKPVSQRIRNTEQTVASSSRPATSAAAQRKSISVSLTPEEARQAAQWGMSLVDMAKRKAHIAKHKSNDPHGAVPIMIY
jgi:hypothetical protein